MNILIPAIVGGVVGFFTAIIVTASGERDRLRHQRNIDRLLSGLQGAAKEQGESVQKALQTIVGSAEEGRQFAAIVDEALKSVRGLVSGMQSKLDRYVNRVEATEDRLREMNVSDQKADEALKVANDTRRALDDFAKNIMREIYPSRPVKKPVAKKPHSKSEARRLEVQKGKKV